METYLIYIGKSALAAGAFYLVFLLLFQNQKEFVFNRIYLPVSLALSFIIPLITFTKTQLIEAVTTTSFDNSAFLTYLPETTQELEFTPQWFHYLIGIYLLGIAGFLFHLLLGHVKAISIVRFSRIKELFKTEVNITPKDVHPFSFFNKIVLSENTLKKPSLEIIVSHENIHVKEKHTLDILFAEILFLAQWFNPFAWLLKDAIKNNLEYKTDHQIAKTYNPQHYQLAMVELADKEGIAPFLTALNGSQLKNRIIMMKKKTENKYAFLKQLVVLPLLAILIMGLANREIKTKIVQTEKKTEIEIKGKITDKKGEPIPGASVVIKGKQLGTVTDKSGNYLINIEETDKTLIFGFLDISKQEININNKTRIDVELDTETKQKSTVQNMTGNPFEGTMKLRNSDGEMAKPLFVVDGNIVENLDKLNPHNIQSQSILLAESAKPFYGDKGKNGVVQIATKNWKFTSNEHPLIIVDDKEFTGSLNDIPKDKIFQIFELRYPNQTQKYGDKGKDGVIEIKTTSMQAVGPLTDDEKSNRFPFAFYNNQTELNSFEKSNLKNKVSGKVTNESGEALAGVTVIVKGKPIGTITDIDGNYKLQTENKIESLVFVLKDYKKQEIALDENSSHVNVLLKMDDLAKLKSGEKKPLIIIDGETFTGEMSEINQENIKSVDVLKYESATALYGENGKNGVIIISTKERETYNSNKTKFNGTSNIEDYLTSRKEGQNQPMFVIDGKGVKNIDHISPNDIESVTVLNNASAPIVYGEKGKNGVILITTKAAAAAKAIGKAQLIVDGKEFYGDINDIPVSDIASIEVKKNQPDNNIYDGKGPEKDKIIIQTNTKYNTNEENLLIVTDGIITGYKSLEDIDPHIIESMNIIKGDKAIEKYGDDGKNGVIEMTLKHVKIDSELRLRKFIAKEIRYPVIAQEANREKEVLLFAQIDKKGKITTINEKSSKSKINLDEVVVTALKSKKLVATGYGSKEEADKARKIEEQLLVDETKRVINKIPVIEIPEFKGKTIGITVKYILQ